MSQKKLPSSLIIGIVIALIVFGIDWLSKYWVSHSMSLGQSIPLIPYFSLTYVKNPGAAFSAFSGHRWPLALIAIVISAAIIYYLYKNDHAKRLENLALSLILGGALGNLFDRLVHGEVIDYFHFYIGEWSYPIFNVADCAICIGVFLFLCANLFFQKKKQKGE